MKKFIFCLSLLTLGSVTFAQGAGVGSSGYKNVNNTKGLCTNDNKEESYFKEGVCLTLVEAITKDKCTAPLLEKLRKKMLQRLSGNPTGNRPNDNFNTGLTCSSRQGNVGSIDYEEKILKNPVVFGTIVTQFFMALAIAESNLDVFNNLQKGPGRMINSSNKGGLMNLTLEQMDDPKYNKDGCGCKVTNSSQQTAWFWSLFVGEMAFAESFLSGPSPGPRDAHHSIQCGAYMALVEAEKDGSLFAGYKGGQGDEAPQGAAKIFASLQEIKTNRPSANPDDPDLASNPQLNFIKKKVRSYCKRNVKEDGSLVETFESMFGSDGSLRSPK